jgi:hypothetical protein
MITCSVKGGESARISRKKNCQGSRPQLGDIPKKQTTRSVKAEESAHRTRKKKLPWLSPSARRYSTKKTDNAPGQRWRIGPPYPEKKLPGLSPSARRYSKKKQTTRSVRGGESAHRTRKKKLPGLSPSARRYSKQKRQRARSKVENQPTVPAKKNCQGSRPQLDDIPKKKQTTRSVKGGKSTHRTRKKKLPWLSPSARRYSKKNRQRARSKVENRPTVPGKRNCQGSRPQLADIPKIKDNALGQRWRISPPYPQKKIARALALS